MAMVSSSAWGGMRDAIAKPAIMPETSATSAIGGGTPAGSRAASYAERGQCGDVARLSAMATTTLRSAAAMGRIFGSLMRAEPAARLDPRRSPRRSGADSGHRGAQRPQIDAHE